MSVISQCYNIIIYQGISAHGHGNEVLYGINSVDKRYIYQLMSTVQLLVSNRFDSQMNMHTGNQKYDVSLAKEFQHHMTKEHRKNGVFDQCKIKRRFMERKCTDSQYHVQDNPDVAHQDVRMYCNTNKFPSLTFCGPHSKPHGARVFSKHSRFFLNPKLGNGVCAICRIPCACVACTSILDKPWISGIPSY